MPIARLVLMLAAVLTANVLASFAAAEGTPTATEVKVTSDAGTDATYGLDETIEVTVTFSEVVNVTGTPGLAIDMDPASWGRKRAVYARGSGTEELVFAHEVVEPNYSTRGIAVLANTLSLDGGAIRSASSGAEASLTHAGLPHDAAHKVDWRRSPRATARSATPPPDATPPELVRGEVDGSTMRLVFSEALDPDATGGRFMVDLATEPLSSAFHAAGAVTVEGAVVTVELGEGNVRAQAGRLVGNRVTYIRRADGGGGALRDLAGNPVAAGACDALWRCRDVAGERGVAVRGHRPGQRHRAAAGHHTAAAGADGGGRGEADACLQRGHRRGRVAGRTAPTR